MTTQICNRDIFIYKGGQQILYVIVGLNSLTILFLLYKMCILCSTAFSYSHFHMHQTYRLYALSLLSLFLMLLARKAQIQYNTYKLKDESQKSVQVQQGYHLINDIFGIFNAYASNVLFIHNGFTWLMISLGCDSRINIKNQQSQSNIGKSGIQHDQTAYSQTNKGKIIKRVSILIMIFFIPLLLSLTLVGTLKKDSDWCTVSDVSITISTIFSLLLFTSAVSIFLYKRLNDVSIDKKVKILLIYLIISMILRQVYFIIHDLDSNSIFSNQYVTLVQVIVCALGPIFGMSYLAQLQLQNQKCVILKNSQVLLFASMINK